MPGPRPFRKMAFPIQLRAAYVRPLPCNNINPGIQRWIPGFVICEKLHQAAVQCFDFLDVRVAGVAGATGIGKGGLGQELDILFLQNAL